MVATESISICSAACSDLCIACRTLWALSASNTIYREKNQKKITAPTIFFTSLIVFPQLHRFTAKKMHDLTNFWCMLHGACHGAFSREILLYACATMREMDPNGARVHHTVLRSSPLVSWCSRFVPLPPLVASQAPGECAQCDFWWMFQLYHCLL